MKRAGKSGKSERESGTDRDDGERWMAVGGSFSNGVIIVKSGLMAL